MNDAFSLVQGREYLAIPGPSVIPDAVLRAMHRPAPNIYEGELVSLTETVIRDLRHLVKTEGNLAIYIGNGHAAWEAALANTVAPDETVLALATGRFGYGWGEVAAGLGANTKYIDFGKQASIDCNRLAEELANDTDRRIKAVLATHVDTSTSVRNSIASLREVLDAQNHPALLMVDCIASLACEVFAMDTCGVDVAVAASQKGLMVPPGLGFVFFSDKAEDACRRMPRVSRYWDWQPRINPEIYYLHFNGTAPTHHLYGLRKALDMLIEEGMPNVWRRHRILAKTIWAACEVWAQGGALRMNLDNPDIRSHAVTSLALPAPKARELQRWTRDQIGLTLGIGLGMDGHNSPAGDDYFRLGHMGHINAHMILGLLGGLESGFRALDIPVGRGALEAAAQVVADNVPPCSSPTSTTA